MPEDLGYGPRDTNDEVEAQIREEKRQRAEEIAYAGYSTRATGVVARELEAAVLAERERCAKIAEQSSQCGCPCHSSTISLCPECCDGGADAGEYIAAKIRSGE